MSAGFAGGSFRPRLLNTPSTQSHFRLPNHRQDRVNFKPRCSSSDGNWADHPETEGGEPAQDSSSERIRSGKGSARKRRLEKSAGAREQRQQTAEEEFQQWAQSVARDDPELMEIFGNSLLNPEEMQQKVLGLYVLRTASKEELVR